MKVSEEWTTKRLVSRPQLSLTIYRAATCIYAQPPSRRLRACANLINTHPHPLHYFHRDACSSKRQRELVQPVTLPSPRDTVRTPLIPTVSLDTTLNVSPTDMQRNLARWHDRLTERHTWRYRDTLVYAQAVAEDGRMRNSRNGRSDRSAHVAGRISTVTDESQRRVDNETTRFAPSTFTDHLSGGDVHLCAAAVTPPARVRESHKWRCA